MPFASTPDAAAAAAVRRDDDAEEEDEEEEEEEKDEEEDDSTSRSNCSADSISRPPDLAIMRRRVEDDLVDDMRDNDDALCGNLVVADVHSVVVADVVAR